MERIDLTDDSVRNLSRLIDEDVDMTDLVELIGEWLDTGDSLKADIAPIFIGNDKVDLADLAEFGKYWMVE